MEKRFSDDYYNIIYSEDELVLFYKCVESYQSEDRLNFLKYLRNEFLPSNVDNLFKEFYENLDEHKMSLLGHKKERFEEIGKEIDRYINDFPVYILENTIVHVETVVHISLEPAKQDALLEMLYEKLNERFINTSLNNFKRIFLKTSFEPIKWNGTNAELKGLMLLLTDKFKFYFGTKSNIWIAERFYKVLGETYNISSLGKCNYQDVVKNNPKNDIYGIVDEIRNQIP